MDKTILNKIKVNVEASTKLDVALQFICDTLSSEISGYDWVGFYFHNEKTEELNLLVFSGLPTPHTKIPFGKGICGRTAKSNEAYISADVSKESNEVEIEVERVLINGCEYLKTVEGVILDSKTYEVLDIKE